MNGRKATGEKGSSGPKELQTTQRSRSDDVASTAGHSYTQQSGQQTSVPIKSQSQPRYNESSSSHFRGSKSQFSHQPYQRAYSSSHSYQQPACVLYGTQSLNPYLYNAAGPVYVYPHPPNRTMGYSTQHLHQTSTYTRGQGLYPSAHNFPNSGLFNHINVSTHVPVMRFSSGNVAQPALKTSRPDKEEEYVRSSSRARRHAKPARRENKIQRQWEYTEYGRAHMTRAKPGVEFSVLSYNILAQRLLEDNSYLYPHCSEDVLDWEKRRTRLLQEIISYKPDVLCLQEVQENHYEDFLLPQLADQGYEGVFQKRTGDKPDGCAIFVKTGNLKICEFFPIIYNRGDLLDRDNVALIVKLKAENNGKEAEVFVATTHLLFNPRRGDIKLAQLSLLFAELDKLAHVDSTSDVSAYSPIILCGDFNTEPHSDIYKFVVRGYIRYEGLMCRKLSGQEDGDRGRDIYLGKQLMPSHVKVTDQCQYVHSIEKRNIPISGNVSRTFNVENPDPKADNPRGATVDIKGGPSVTSSDESESGTSRKINHRHSPTVSMNTGCLWHKLNLVSAYKHSIERLLHFAPEVTTQHRYASCTLDYIFYNVRSKQTHTKTSRVVTRDIEEDRLRLIGRYGLLSSRELSDMGGLPNKYLASDHLGLLTKFLLQYR